MKHITKLAAAGLALVTMVTFLTESSSAVDFSTTGQSSETLNGQYDYAPDYPGRSASYSFNLAHYNIQLGLIHYYKVFGHWPPTWSAVVESGIHQTPLIAFGGEEIDPDDKQLDYVGDIYYFPEPSEDGSALIYKQAYVDGMITERQLIPQPVTYNDYFATYFQVFPECGWDAYCDDTARLIQFAVIEQCIRSAEHFKRLNGRFPFSLDELLDSRLGPIDADSVNHLTGDRYFGDGRANDMLYEYASGGEISVRATGDDGAVLNIIFD